MRLETERLILRRFDESDTPALAEILADPEVTRNLLVSPMTTTKDVRRLIARRNEALDKGEAYPLAVVIKESGALAGVCMLKDVSRDHLHAELVYYLGKEHWGKGYMTEAARRMLQFGFEELGLERIEVGCFARNEASARVIEKLGFTYEGRFRHRYMKDSEFLDELRFGMIREDWERRRER